MNKKYLAIVVIALVAWIGLMGHRHFKKTEETRQHYAEAYSRIEASALKSPRGGLTQMALALNKFFQENGHYPPKLMDLYPRFVASRSFINRINWRYRPNVDHFSLSKTITLRNRKITAAIDKKLNTTTETQVILAAADPVPQTAAPAPRGKPAVKPVSAAVPQAAPAITNGPVTQAPPSAPAAYTESGNASEMAAFLSRRFLVWKDPDGHLGFGNTDYPKNPEIAICTAERWLKRTSAASLSDGQNRIQRPAPDPGKGRAIDAIAEAVSDRFLVWKTRDGAIGFGNVDYPESGDITICTADQWRRRTGAPPVSGSRNPAVRTAPDREMETIASLASSRFLVWKTREGAIGFGNVGYPSTRDIAQVYSAGDWQAVAN